MHSTFKQNDDKIYDDLSFNAFITHQNSSKKLAVNYCEIAVMFKHHEANTYKDAVFMTKVFTDTSQC